LDVLRDYNGKNETGQLGAANKVKEGSLPAAITMEELTTGAETQAYSAAGLSESMGNFVDNVKL
jgi:methyl-accepting chemotaxis protein